MNGATVDENRLRPDQRASCGSAVTYPRQLRDTRDRNVSGNPLRKIMDSDGRLTVEWRSRTRRSQAMTVPKQWIDTEWKVVNL